MLEEELKQYVDNLYENQGDLPELKGLFTKKEYYQLLKPVVELLEEKKGYTIDEMREILYKKSQIEEGIKEIINKKDMAPGIVLKYGTKDFEETIVTGNRQEVTIDSNGNIIPAVEEMTEDTIFDLASTTKLFTSLSILKLIQDGVIRIDDKVIKYAPQFKNLGDVTIFDLLSFRVPIKTSQRIDTAGSKKQATDILYGIEVDKNNPNLRPYTDMGAMVLKYVIQGATKEGYYQYVEENILKPLFMFDTHAQIPTNKLDKTANNNLSGKLFGSGIYVIDRNCPRGVVHDYKARIMESWKGDLTGHAGMFSTPEDMVKLIQGILKGVIIDKRLLEEMAINRTGKKYYDETGEHFVQFLGFFSHLKNPISEESSVYLALNKYAQSFPGYTGIYALIDPLDEIYLFQAANRLHNRAIFIDPSQKDKIIVNGDGKKSILLPDKRIITDSSRFAWDRDPAIIIPATRLVLQYKMLEDMCRLLNIEVTKSKKNRKI